MDHYVIYYCFRGHDKFPVEVKITNTAAASPAFFLLFNSNFIITHTQLNLINLYPFLYLYPVLVFIPFNHLLPD
jgi:hypothetical protein